jgi:hypothetical protein
MTVSAIKGSVAATSGTQTVSSGGGITPKAVLVWGTLLTAAGFGATMRGFQGVAATGIQQHGYCWASDDNAAAQNCQYQHSAGAIRMISDGAGTVDALATIGNFASGAFDIVWSDAPSSAWIIHYLVLGGADLTAKVVHYTSPTATGNRDDTGAGFTPEAVIYLGCGTTGAADGTSNFGSASIGAATSSSARWAAMMTETDNGVTMASASHFNAAKCLIMRRNPGSGDHTQADFVAFTSDGATLNWTPVATIAMPYTALYLVDSAGSFYVGTDTQKTSTGTQAKTGVGFYPSALLFAGVDSTTDGSQVNGAARVVGATDGTNVGYTWNESQHGIADSETNVRTSVLKVFGSSTGPSTTNAEAELNARGADGYTLDWTAADGNARDFGVFATQGTEPAPSSTPQRKLLMGVS